MARTTVRLFFRNIMFFVHDKHGTDVWFLDNHRPRVFTADTVASLDQTVVQIYSENRPLPGSGKQTIDLPRVISFNRLAPRGVLSETIQERQLSNHLVARLELPLAGALRDLPSVHSFGVLLEWRTPILGAGEPHIQRLTEVAMYEVPDVAEPIELLLTRDGKERHVPLSPSEKGHGRPAEAFFAAGELPKRPHFFDGPRGVIKIQEFEALHNCFDYSTRKGLHASDVIPVADEPDGAFVLRSADPFCPSARIDLRETE